MTFTLDDPMEKGECSRGSGARDTTKLHDNPSTNLKPPATYDDDDDIDDDDLLEGNAASVVSQRRKDT